MKDVLHYIGLLSLFISTLFGGFFLKGSDSALPFIAGGLILVFVVYYLVKLMADKKKQTHSNLVHKAVLWGIYVIIAAGGGILSTHFLTVQFAANEDLKNNGNEKLEVIQKMKTVFNDSEKKKRKELRTNVTESLSSFVQAPMQEKPEHKNTLMNLYHFDAEVLDDLKNSTFHAAATSFMKKHYTNKIKKFKDPINKTLNDYYGENKDVFNNGGDFLNTNKVYYELNPFLIKNKNKLETEFKDLIDEYDIRDDVFNSLIIPPTNVELNSLSGLRKQYSSLIPIGIYLSFHLLILFPILLTRKEGKTPLSEEDDTTVL